MFILIAFAFLAGIVTILSPCILPVLPIILSGSALSGKKQPFGVLIGFVSSFTFFTLFLTSIVQTTGVSADLLRTISMIIIFGFGLVLVVPKFYLMFEIFASKLSSKAGAGKVRKEGFISGIILGFSLGLIWTPCVGPILASVIALAITGSVSGQAFLITLAYSLGTSIPMILIMYGGRGLISKVPWLTKNLGKIQKVFGVLMILTALAIFFNYDRQFQSFILEKFPNYGSGLIKIEENDLVKENLTRLKDEKEDSVVSQDLDEENLAPEIIPGGEWFNSQPLKLADLKGKVILIDFWTYTCINCIRTFPYIQSWHEKYKDYGLVIIGVHTPEFEFEKNPKNLDKAIKDFELTYPIVQDNNYSTWQAYDNHYWPAKYLVDKDGKIRYTHFGEGEYDQTETMIQKLLSEAGSAVNDAVANPTYQVQTRTPETYLGFERMAGLISPERVLPNKTTTFTTPVTIKRNTFAMSGTWTIGAERAMPAIGATLTYHFDATEVFLVMRPKTSGLVANVKITLDEKEVGAFAGDDAINGVVTIDSDRLYKLIKLPSIGAHMLKLEFLDDNAELFAFTFG